MLNTMTTAGPKPAQRTNGIIHRLGEMNPVFYPTFNSIKAETDQQPAMALTMISDVAQILASTSNLDDLLNHLLDLVTRMFKIETGAALLADPSDGELVLQAAIDKGQPVEAIEACRLPVPHSVCGYVAQRGKPVLLAEVTPRQRKFIKLATLLDVKPRCLLYVPLTVSNRVIGVLGLINKADRTFTREDLKALNSIAAYAALAIENARLRQQMAAERKRAMAVEAQVRKAVARDLHDGPTQLVSAILMHLDYCQKAIQQDPTLIRDELVPMQALGFQAMHQLRTMLVELRPLELEPNGQGLAAALRLFLKRRQQEVKQTQLILEVQSHRPDNQISRLAPEVEGAIYAIAQETVNNALKHAQAEQIVVRLEETPEMFRTLVADNGRGFDLTETMDSYTQRGSLGMLNIHERAEAIGGELSIKSAPGEGTRISLIVSKTNAQQLR